ncbi:hypothetical protein GCM10010912_21930 [Paenibacillus albidus]|uniref:Uncharacterized protein n=1 Tax=Paenibacillus albidus TaxID=2041023 RepID=A0A917C7S3_9BACL|nr:hypothetical protein GCM10010912_21930 [Paenibacillus albidus]
MAMRPGITRIRMAIKREIISLMRASYPSRYFRVPFMITLQCQKVYLHMTFVSFVKRVKGSTMD